MGRLPPSILSARNRSCSALSVSFTCAPAQQDHTHPVAAARLLKPAIRRSAAAERCLRMAARKHIGNKTDCAPRTARRRRGPAAARGCATRAACRAPRRSVARAPRAPGPPAPPARSPAPARTPPAARRGEVSAPRSVKLAALREMFHTCSCKCAGNSAADALECPTDTCLNKHEIVAILSQEQDLMY